MEFGLFSDFRFEGSDEQISHLQHEEYYWHKSNPLWNDIFDGSEMPFLQKSAGWDKYISYLA